VRGTGCASGAQEVRTQPQGRHAAKHGMALEQAEMNFCASTF